MIFVTLHREEKGSSQQIKSQAVTGKRVRHGRAGGLVPTDCPRQEQAPVEADAIAACQWASRRAGGLTLIALCGTMLLVPIFGARTRPFDRTPASARAV
jgi:hypothetical protein